jgi:hypothetical protein
MSGNPVVRQIFELARLEQLEAAAIARVLGTRQRNGRHLLPTALFSSIEVMSWGQHVRVTLQLPVSSTLAFQDLQPYLLDQRYGRQPQISHHSDGIAIRGTNHHFTLGRYELVIDIPHDVDGRTAGEQAASAISDGIDQASAGGRRDRVRSVHVTTRSTLPAHMSTLRAFRKWAAENP